MSADIKRIVILGGGSAAWLSAALIAAEHRGGLQLTLLESPDVPAIGVGEGTWPTMRDTLRKIGVSDTELVRQCEATFKQGSKFIGWVNGRADDHYDHPFVLPQGYTEANLVVPWLQRYGKLPFAELLSFQPQLCARGLAPKQAATPEYAAVANYGYHFDALKFGHFLRRHCLENLGVQHLQDHKARMFALTFPAEFRSIQAHYPIVFRKTPDGSGFEPIALLGFEAGENLFVQAGRWDAAYLPLAIERQPFLIGRSGEELLIHIDLGSPRVSRTVGEPLFLPHGGNSEFLQRINSVLLNLHQGLEGSAAFIKTLLAHELLESFVLDIELADGSQNRLAGFYTIHEERLAALPGSTLEALGRAGHLQAIYMAVASLSQMRALIERKNKLPKKHAS